GVIYYALIGTAALSVWLLCRGLNVFSPGQGVAGSGGGFSSPTVTPVQNSSASVAATATSATLPAVAGKTTYIEGFDVCGGGATAGSQVSITITGLASQATMTVVLNVVAGAAVGVGTGGLFSVRFPTPLPASAANTTIVVNLPSLGSGNTGANV